MSDISGVSFGSSGLQRHKYGNSSIQYSPDGRILSGNGTGVSAHYSNDYGGYGGYQSENNTYRSQQRSQPQPRRVEAPRYASYRRENNQFGTGFEPPAPLSDLRDDRPRYAQQRYRTGSDLVRPSPHHRVPDTWRGRDPISGGGQRRGRGERRRAQDRKGDRRYRSTDPLLKGYGVFFVMCGILILICALLNVLFSSEHHYWSGWWAGFLVMEFGLVLCLHRGGYHKHTKNRVALVFGLLSILGVAAATAVTLETLVDKITVLLFSDTDTLVTDYHTADWTVRLTDVSQEVRVWVTFGTDCAVIVLYAIGLVQVFPLIRMFNRYWEENFRTTNTCQPWSVPRYFNPFGQLVLAELIALVGLVVRYACLTRPEDIAWSEYWVPVWGAGLLFVASIIAIMGFKRPDRTTLVYCGVVLQLLAGVAMGAGVVVCVNGLVENTEYIQDEVLTDDMDRRIIVSAGLYGLCAALQLPMMIYCMVVLGRLHVIGNKHRRATYRDDRSFESASTTPPVRDRFVHGYPYGHSNTPLPPPPKVYPVYPNYFGNQVQRY